MQTSKSIKVCLRKKVVEPMVTITDIANACGVSRATVSKALNGASDVAQETAKRVRETAKALGYLPNETQQHTLHQSRSI